MVYSRLIYILLPTLLSLSSGFAKGAPSASEVIRQAEKEARLEKKNVLIDFGASWCPWCRRTETLLEHSQFSSKFQDSYVIAHVTVRERESKRDLENLGWEKEMKGYRKIEAQDIPYVVILSPLGRVLAKSYDRPGKIPDNAAFPSTPLEVDSYIAMIRKTGKAFTDSDLESLKNYFHDASASPAPKQ